jgi:microcompartment protein CcmK/EutM
MFLGKVIGTVVATRKDPKLEGTKLLLVQQSDMTGQIPTQSKSPQVVCIDSVGAGLGEVVLFCQGSSARQTETTQQRPVDAVIMAIVDEVEIGNEVTYRKC